MFFHHLQKQLQACKYYICSLYQELCGELHAKINVVDEERYDIEAKVHHNTREVKKQFITHHVCRKIKGLFGRSQSQQRPDPDMK